MPAVKTSSNDDINKLTDDVNNYLKDHKDFKDSREFNNRANTLYLQISKTRNQLENDSSIENTAMKYKLDALFKAQQDRLRGSMTVSAPVRRAKTTARASSAAKRQPIAMTN